MPYFEDQMIDAYRELDGKVAMGDAQGIERCCARIREIDSQSMANFGPEWLADVVKSKGIRLPSLEHALKVEKVIIKGDISLKHGWLDALTGKKPFAIDRATIELHVTW